MRAIAYLRVSTTEQAATGLSLEAQRAALEAEATRRGWGSVTFAADTASGKSTTGRPALLEALEALDRGEADVLVVARLDRLARSLADFAAILDRAERRGWAVVALDAADTTTPSGRLMVSLLAAFSQYERDLIAARTREALAVRKAQGVRLGRPVLVRTELRARVAELRAEGRTLQAIADLLNAEGVTTPSGGTWFPASVARTLRSHRLDAEAAEIRAARAAA